MGIKVDFRKRFYKNNERKKGKDPSFTVDVNFEAGNELAVLFGQSGSGKTTTLRCIAGLEKPSGGKITVNGTVYFDCHKAIDLPPQKRSLGYVFQNYALFPHMDVKKNITYGLKGMTDQEKENRMRQMLHLLHIEGLEDYYPSQLSGGQKQRVALARALAPGPDILLLDEPFSALDMIVRMKLRERIKLIQKELNIPVLFITHNPVEAFTLGDKIIVFHEGKVQQTGTPEEVFYQPKNRHVAELVGVNNIFDDAVFASHIDKDRTLFKAGELEIITRHIEIKTDKRISWGIRPENITLLNSDKDNRELYENHFSGKVISIVNKGASKLIAVRSNKERRVLISEVSNKAYEELNLFHGCNCTFSFASRDVLIFV
ncbi:MAG: ABC transporter ATP-binding protein [Methanomethylovorans sp.]|jgi:molybdate transport system ATP-binding protein|nr:ABC transporter ATP-binding protein [Methanomethylovorans sp.]